MSNSSYFYYLSSLVKTGRGTKKTPVFGIKERESGKVYARIMFPDELGKKLTGRQLLDMIGKVCKEGTTIISDDFSSHKILDEPDFLMLFVDLEPTTRLGHKTVCHSLEEYVGVVSIRTGLRVSGRFSSVDIRV